MTTLEAWDKWLVERGPDAGFLQTSQWASLHQAVNGAEPHLVVVTDEDGELAAGALMSFRRARAMHGHRGPPSRPSVLESHEGPVLSLNDRPRLIRELLDRVDELAERLGAGQVSFHGPPAASTWAQEPSVTSAFQSRGYRTTAWLSSLVDLQRDDEELLSGFRRAAGKAVRRARDAGLTVAKCQTYDEYLRDFVEPFQRAGGRESPVSPRVAWDLDVGQHYRYFVAKDPEGRVLATLGTYSFNGVATEVMSRRITASSVKPVPVQDLLHWEAFRAHRQAGDTVFDLAGFSPDPQNAKEAGIRRFKEKWGGREVPIPRFTLERRPVVVRGFDRVVGKISALADGR